MTTFGSFLRPMPSAGRMILLSLLLTAAGLLRAEPAAAVAETAFQKEDPYPQIMLLTNVMEILRDNYVDESKVTYERLIAGALRGMLRELDPYSAYDTPEEHRRNSDDLNGQQVGLGVMIRKNDYEAVKVMAVIPNSSAAQAGIQAGDWLVEVDGFSTLDATLEECMRRLSGPVDSEVQLKVYREEEDELHEVTVTRCAFARNSVPSNGIEMLPGGYGYIRIESFTSNTPAELDRALKQLNQKSMHALVLDLRNNPGGLLDAALAVCDRFLGASELLLFIEGRRESDREVFYAGDSTVKYLNLPLAILVNGHSASAAEIVSGCLKDHRRAALIGEKTFGKGSVQRVHQLDNAGAIRFTIAKYYTPSRNLIHGVGIEPDLEVELPEEEELPLKLLREPAGLRMMLEDGSEWNDTQLQEALFYLEKETGANSDR